jgi:hypothetical protein
VFVFISLLGCFHLSALISSCCCFLCFCYYWAVRSALTFTWNCFSLVSILCVILLCVFMYSYWFLNWPCTAKLASINWIELNWATYILRNIFASLVISQFYNFNIIHAVGTWREILLLSIIVCYLMYLILSYCDISVTDLCNWPYGWCASTLVVRELNGLKNKS